MVSISPDLDRSLPAQSLLITIPLFLSLPGLFIWPDNTSKSTGSLFGIAGAFQFQYHSPFRRHAINNAIVSEKSIFIFNFVACISNMRLEDD
jgi:hypothetical protein